MEYILIGTIVNTFGIKGELKIKSHSDFDDERYKKGNRVYINYNGEYLPYEVNSFRVHKGMSIVSFKNNLDINLVEKYKGCDIYFDKAKIQRLDEGEHYWFELKGLDVYDEADNYLGKIINVEETRANSNLRIEKVDGKTFLVPNIKQFVLKIDKENNKAIIKVIEGLI